MGILSRKPQYLILAKKLKTRWNLLEGCREPQTQEEGWRGRFWQLEGARKWGLVSCFVRAPPSFPSCPALPDSSNSSETEQAFGSARATRPLLPGPGCAGAPQLGIPRQHGCPQREEEFKLGWEGPALSTSADSGLREGSRARLPDFRSSFYTNIWEKLCNPSGPLFLH